MKSISLWLTIVAITATSCTKTEVLDNTPQGLISFDTSIGKSSKAGPIAGTTFPTDDPNYHFSIFAFYKPEGGAYDYNTPYINDEVAVYVNSTWKNEAIHYWPTSGSLKFISYAPWEAFTPTYNTTDGLIIEDFDDASSLDIMYTDISGDLTAGAVDLTFKHALTQMYFTIATSQSGVTFHIKRIQLEDVIGKGTFKSLATPQWELSTDPTWLVTYTPYFGNTVVRSDDLAPANLGDPIMLIPQPVTAISIKVTYDLLINGGNTITNKTKEVTLTGADWAPNQRIKYALDIADGSLNEITYNPIIEAWDAETVK